LGEGEASFGPHPITSSPSPRVPSPKGGEDSGAEFRLSGCRYFVQMIRSLVSLGFRGVRRAVCRLATNPTTATGLPVFVARPKVGGYQALISGTGRNAAMRGPRGPTPRGIRKKAYEKASDRFSQMRDDQLLQRSTAAIGELRREIAALRDRIRLSNPDRLAGMAARASNTLCRLPSSSLRRRLPPDLKALRDRLGQRVVALRAQVQTVLQRDVPPTYREIIERQLHGIEIPHDFRRVEGHVRVLQAKFRKLENSAYDLENSYSLYRMYEGWLSQLEFGT